MFGRGYLAGLNRLKTEWWGCFDGSVLVAVASLEVNAYADALLSSCAVLPAYRGKGIQRRLIRARCRWLARHAEFGNAATYTHSSTPQSLLNLIREGFVPTEVRGDIVYLFRDLGFAVAACGKGVEAIDVPVERKHWVFIGAIESERTTHYRPERRAAGYTILGPTSDGLISVLPEAMSGFNPDSDPKNWEWIDPPTWLTESVMARIRAKETKIETGLVQGGVN